jgi:tetratricopeptide (TPR) repeat protein
MAQGDLGHVAEALPLMERALRIDNATYGPEHPNVARDLTNLAFVYRGLGDPTEARALMERALRIFERVFPAGHPTRIAADKNLASF